MNPKRIKAPVCYYGGKIRMSAKIVSLIPKHTLYCEPFCGGAAVFFRKPPSEIEVLNDHDDFIVNFYQVLKHPSKAQKLKEMLEQTPYSRQQLKLAHYIYTTQELHNNVQKARAFWMLCNLSFSGTMGGGYKFSKKSNKNVKSFHCKKDYINKALVDRLNNVDIECRDAIAVIKSRDTKESFFYLDPPYVVDENQKVNQGHYAGYTSQDYTKLLDTLSQMKGKFLLSNYPSKILFAYAKLHQWHVLEHLSAITAENVNGSGNRKYKTELLIANYPLDEMLHYKLKHF